MMIILMMMMMRRRRKGSIMNRCRDVCRSSHALQIVLGGSGGQVLAWGVICSFPDICIPPVLAAAVRVALDAHKVSENAMNVEDATPLETQTLKSLVDECSQVHESEMIRSYEVLARRRFCSLTGATLWALLSTMAPRFCFKCLCSASECIMAESDVKEEDELGRAMGRALASALVEAPGESNSALAAPLLSVLEYGKGVDAPCTLKYFGTEFDGMVRNCCGTVL